MEKTEKTMAELEIDQNVKFEWDKILEAGAELQPLSGPGYSPISLLSLALMFAIPFIEYY